MATVASPEGTREADTRVPLDSIPISPADDSKHHAGESSDDSGVGMEPDPNMITVFHDSENFNVKHPLLNTWTLWFTKPPSGKGDSWNELLKEVISFDSVEEFWGIYNNIAPVSELAVKSDYHLFKKGVRPEWEDPQNKHGGKWAYTSKSRTGIAIDELWLNVMLAAIGETLEDEDDSEVMGVVVNVRKGFYRIGLWTRNNGGRGGGDAKKVETLTRLGKNFKEALQLNDPETVDFTGHMDSAKAGSTRAKSAISI